MRAERIASARRRTIADRVREAVIALAGGYGSVVAQRERAWASITFTGARHELTLLFDGDAAIAAGERLIADLAEHEFAIPRHLVADARVVAADHALLPRPSLRVTCELLVLDEA